MVDLERLRLPRYAPLLAASRLGPDVTPAAVALPPVPSEDRGLAVGFLRVFTDAFGLGDLPTHAVVRDFVKPLTECHRCRLVDLGEVRPFTGRAATFASHAWGGRWGDLVAALSDGNPPNWAVWIGACPTRWNLTHIW